MLRWKGRELAAICNCCIEPLTAPGVSRRQFVAGAAAAGVAATGFAPKVFAQAKPHRIDVHCHIVPPTWLAAMDVIGRKDFPLANWSVQKPLDDMDKGGVAAGITSPTTPQVTPLGREDRGQDRARVQRILQEDGWPTIPAASASSRCCRCRTSTTA